MPGAGRPVGSKTGLKASKSQLAKLLEAGGVKSAIGAHDGTKMPKGFTPLQVMEAAMARAWELGGPLFAFNFAKEAAPFRHAKLSSLSAGGGFGGGGQNGGGAQVARVRVEVEFVRPTKKEDA
jgi:hypothetical protein